MRATQTTRRFEYVGGSSDKFWEVSLNGKEVLACVKSSARLRSIPIIVLSTSRAPEDVRRSYELHANCYISKPTDLNAVIDMISRIADFWLDLVTPAPKAVE